LWEWQIAFGSLRWRLRRSFFGKRGSYDYTERIPKGGMQTAEIMVASSELTRV
jgi:hypothetical protein